MSAYLRIRRRILTPDPAEATVARRGFHAKHAESVTVLETIGRSFISGYGFAVGTAAMTDARTALETIPQRFRGFAYEGAAMGYAMLDGLGLGRAKTTSFLSGPAAPHRYMAYIGIGWACARLPRWRWRRVLPVDPLLCWLVLDGYGFHQAYFHTAKYVSRCHTDQLTGWPFPDAGRYGGRAVDQGIGRALWFVGGADVAQVAGLIASFPEHRWADLWSGAGLAATYAGGADEAELRTLRELAGAYRSQLAQGSAFAAEARDRAGLQAAHTELATRILCQMSPSEAAEIAREVQRQLPTQAPVPLYELWRQQLAQRFES